MQATSATIYTTPVKYILGSNTASCPSLVLLERVQKLKAQMCTLLHHIQPSMQRSIAEADERLEFKMAQHKWKIIEVHHCFDTFELRTLAQPSPPVDMSTLQAVVDSLREDIYMILESRMPESEAASAEPAEDTYLAASFATSEITPPPLESIPKGTRG